AGPVRPQVRAGGDQVFDAEAAQSLTQVVGGGDDEGLDPALGVGALIDRAAAGDPQVPQRLDPSVTLFGDAGPLPGQRGPGGLDGVDRVGLALEPAGLAVGPVDLDHQDFLPVQQPGQPGAVGTGPLDTDTHQLPERAHRSEEHTSVQSRENL